MMKLSIENSTATNVEIELPVPADSTNPNVRTSMGSASYAPESDALLWKIKSFPGGKVLLRSFETTLDRKLFIWFLFQLQAMALNFYVC